MIGSGDIRTGTWPLPFGWEAMLMESQAKFNKLTWFLRKSLSAQVKHAYCVTWHGIQDDKPRHPFQASPLILCTDREADWVFSTSCCSQVPVYFE